MMVFMLGNADKGIKKTRSQDPRLTIGPPNLVIIAEHEIASPDSKSKGITLFTSTIRRGSRDYLDPKLIVIANFMRSSLSSGNRSWG